MAFGPKKNDEEIKIGANTRQLESALDRVKKGFGKLKETVVKAGAAMGAALAGIGLVTLQYEEASNKLSRAIDRQGRSSDGTTEALNRHSKALQATSHFSKPAIESAQALLVQMSNLRTEAMEPALQVTADMAAMLGTDMQGAAEELAEVMKLPVEAVGTLEKYGVRFTDAEREKMQVMIDSGRLHELQDEILRRLSEATKGQAQATVDGIGALKQLKNQVTNVIAELGTLLYERIEPVVQALIRFFQRLNENKSALENIATVIANVVKVLAGLLIIGTITKAFNTLRNAIILTKAAVIAFGTASKRTIRGILASTGIGLLLVALGLVYDGLYKLKDLTGSWGGAWDYTKDTILLGVEHLKKHFKRLVTVWVGGVAKIWGIFDKDNPAQRALDALNASLDDSDKRIGQLEARRKATLDEGRRARTEREATDMTQGVDLGAGGETGDGLDKTGDLLLAQKQEEELIKQQEKTSQELFEQRQRQNEMRVRASADSHMGRVAEENRRNQEELEAEQEQNRKLEEERNRAREADRVADEEYWLRQDENDKLRKELQFLGKQEWNEMELEYARSQLLTEEKMKEDSRKRTLKREISYRNTMYKIRSKNATLEMKLEAVKNSYLYKSTMSTLGDIQGLQESGNKHLQEVGKAAARAELLLRLAVDPPAAFARTAAAFPAPWGTALGALAAAGVATRLVSGLRQIGGSGGSVPAFTPPAPISVDTGPEDAGIPDTTSDSVEGSGTEGNQTIIVQVDVDKQTIAEAVAEVISKADS